MGGKGGDGSRNRLCTAPQAPAAFLVAERIRHTAAGFDVATVAAFGAAASLAAADAVVEAVTAA